MADNSNPLHDNQRKPTSAKPYALWKVLLPVAIGLGVVALMFIHDAQKEDLGKVLESIDVTAHTVLFLVVAWLFMMGRDIGLSWRFRALTDHQLRWMQAFKVDFLCEFTSCITPSAVGGSSLGMVFLNREGIELGRATTLMITTLFLDELFFVVSCPLVILFTPLNEIFNSGSTAFSHGIQLTFWLVYAGICLWTGLLFMGIIVRPNAIRSLLSKLFSIRILRRWQPSVVALGDNMVATSVELRKKKFSFWLEVFGGTALSWTSRYMVVNAIFMAFLPATCSFFDQWLVLARQFVVWVVLMVSPTPGGSGLSEWLFTEYYADLIPSAGLALIMAICWRLISYYVYLAIGAMIVPGWLKGTFNDIHRHKVKETIAANAVSNGNTPSQGVLNDKNKME